MTQVLKQSVLEGGSRDCACGRCRGAAWDPLTSSAVGEDMTARILPVRAVRPCAVLLNSNESTGSLQCSPLCKSRDQRWAK